jgi:predicted nucleic acid-binding protein
MAGVRKGEVEALEQFFTAVSWVPVGEEVARTAGELARQHRRAHSGIDDVDYLIAATAVLLEAELLTTNVRHFPMLDGLQAPY